MDINAEAEKSLLKTGCSVVFQYPRSFTRLPVISFYTLKEYGAVAYDNHEAVREGTIVADIWARTPKKCAEISEKVRTVMNNDGWTELFAADIPRGSADIYHRSMRLVKSFYTDN